jgi:predicted SnoaL-like aldol condensation-catalyzing enzyme
MDRERAGAWLAAYRRAWEEADTPAVLGLFTLDATYRSHPLRPAHTGQDGIAAYWTQVTADQSDVRVRLGDPIVDGDRVAAEWWTTMHAGGNPVTLAGCLFLTFTHDGRCRSLRECWNLSEQVLDPPTGWGQLDPGTDPDQAATHTRRQAATHARRWAEGYERAWRTGDPEAAAALYAPGTHYRSEPFRDPHPGREGVLAYTRSAYATEADQDPRFGSAFAAGASAAVEWWATMLEEDQPATLIGCSVLTFTPDGLVATGRDYWFLEPGTHPPFEGWGG